MTKAKIESQYVVCQFDELKEVLEQYHYDGFFVLKMSVIYDANQPSRLGIHFWKSKE